jgi:hypothetical protein
LKCLPELEIL